MAELNGVPVDLDQIQALALTNYGHFTSMRVEDQRVRGLSLHLERLTRDCRDAGFATNAAAGIRIISAIDDLQWPDEHPVLNALRKEYTDILAELL